MVTHVKQFAAPLWASNMDGRMGEMHSAFLESFEEIDKN